MKHTKIEFGHNPIALSMFGSDIPNQGRSEEISLDKRIQENVFYTLYTESSEPLQNGRISSEYLGYIEPTTYKQVLNDKYKPHWVKALQKEIDQFFRAHPNAHPSYEGWVGAPYYDARRACVD